MLAFPKLREDELCDMALGLAPIPKDRIFTSEEAVLLANYKVHEMEIIAKEMLCQLKEQAKTISSGRFGDERMTKTTRQVVREYLEMAEEETRFTEFALI